MQGFLRLVTQKAVMGEATHTTEEAWTIYAAHLSGGRTTFLHEPDKLRRADPADQHPRRLQSSRLDRCLVSQFCNHGGLPFGVI